MPGFLQASRYPKRRHTAIWQDEGGRIISAHIPAPIFLPILRWACSHSPLPVFQTAKYTKRNKLVPWCIEFHRARFTSQFLYHTNRNTPAYSSVNNRVIAA